MSADFAGGREFVRREGRVLDRRVMAALFEDGPVAGAVDALRAYRNPDGGFGHGLEPDKRCPESQPLDVELAFQTLDALGTVDDDLVGPACDFLTSVTDDQGAVPVCLPSIEGYPHAEHITDWTYKPALFPTAGLVGVLHKLGVVHPWMGPATDYCWRALAEGMPTDAHALREVAVFVEHFPDRARVQALVPSVLAALERAEHYRSDPDDPAYGVTPLSFAPTPDSMWCSQFGDAVIEGHLDRLERDQQPDGGWAITWTSASEASALEYRAIVTIEAMRALVAYGRLFASQSLGD